MTGRTNVIKVYESFRLGYCKCGCGEYIGVRDNKGKLRRYKKNHDKKGKRAEYQSGQNNKMYKTGITYVYNYRYILMPDYFCANGRGYVAEHRYVYQEYYKVCILPWAEIHHIDPVREGYCNNMVWNLLLVSKSDHRTLDRTKKSDDWKCSNCGSGTYTKPNGRPMWYYNDKDELLCDKCYTKWKYVKKIRKHKSWEGTVCLLCGSNYTTNNGRGNYRWNKYKNGFICMKCYKREYRKKNKG